MSGVKAMLAVLVLAFLSAAAPAEAHKASDSYLRLTASERGIDGEWDIALRDLDQAIGLDGDGDSMITWGEVRAAQTQILAYAFARLQLSADGRPCPVRSGELSIDDHSDGAYAVLPFAMTCAAGASSIDVDYRLFADIDRQHRGLLRFEAGPGVEAAIVGADRPQARFALGATGPRDPFLHFVEEGIWHIWVGADHILFLLALLLPAVLVRRDGRWEAERDLRTVLGRVLQIVTAFTVAHSITLSLAALDVMRMPPRLIECLIAASVIASALNNVVPVIRRRMWLVAFAFGLVHGFGFANVLLDLDLPRTNLALALFGFNVGAELGQLAIVVTFVPLAYRARTSRRYARLAMPAGSLAACMLAALWLIERAFDVSFAPL